MLLEEKAVRLIDFQPQTSPSNNLLKKIRLLKSQILSIKYALFVRNSLKEKLADFQ